MRRKILDVDNDRLILGLMVSHPEIERHEAMHGPGAMA